MRFISKGGPGFYSTFIYIIEGSRNFLKFRPDKLLIIYLTNIIFWHILIVTIPFKASSILCPQTKGLLPFLAIGITKPSYWPAP